MKKSYLLCLLITANLFFSGCATRKLNDQPIKPFAERRALILYDMTMQQVSRVMQQEPDQIISSGNNEIWVYEAETYEPSTRLRRLQSLNVRFNNDIVDYRGYFSCFIPNKTGG